MLTRKAVTTYKLARASQQVTSSNLLAKRLLHVNRASSTANFETMDDRSNSGFFSPQAQKTTRAPRRIPAVPKEEGPTQESYRQIVKAIQQQLREQGKTYNIKKGGVDLRIFERESEGSRNFEINRTNQMQGRNSTANSASSSESSFDKLLRQPRQRGHQNITQPAAVKAASSEKVVSKEQQVNPVASVFAADSTPLLMKKLFVYKLMGSDLFINHALGMMTTCYQVLGIPVTNTAINTSVGSLFTSGETISTLMDDIAQFEKKNISGIANYAVEGLAEMDEGKIGEFYQLCLESIEAQTVGGREGHFAVKFTGLVTVDIMTRWNKAQDLYLYDILQLNSCGDDVGLSIKQFELNLSKHGVNLSRDELTTLFNSLKIDQDEGNLSRVARYANGHLFKLHTNNSNDEEVNAILKKVALGLKDANISEDDLQIFSKFSERVGKIVSHANERNCILYIDAEQTYMQVAIESFAQQLTHEFNRDGKNTILNGYQCYLQRMSQVIEDEVACSKALGYNLGIKLIRGAYMSEERSLAAANGVPSPVWNTIEETHACYNKCMTHVLDNVDERSLLFIASHNNDSIEIAKQWMDRLQIQDDRVRFGQLKGFSDQITGMLAQENYKVYKYLPFGPTETVMPYLIRRGQESKQVLREQEFQNLFLKNEIMNRFKPFSSSGTAASIKH